MILETRDYIVEAQRQLSDLYCTSDHDLTLEFSDWIEKYLTSFHIISRAVYDNPVQTTHVHRPFTTIRRFINPTSH